MKKIIFTVFLLISSIWAKPADEKVMQELLTNVLIKNTNSSIIVAQNFLKDLESKKELSTLKKDFTKLVISWKSVQAFYLAGDFNDDALDTPRYIDVFHNQKENLQEHMIRVIKSSDSLDISMFKHSYKTITALEYVLYDKTFTQKHRDISKIILKNLISRFSEIKTVYENDTKKFLSNIKWANALIINALVDSSFKVKDWRVGDVAGFSRKYKNKADNKRAEYALSKNSYEAVKAIILTHKKVIDSNKYDFGDMLVKNSYNKEVKIIKDIIRNSLVNVEFIKNDDFMKKDVKKLYLSLNSLQMSYYKTLIQALGVTAKILDADGD